MARSDAALFRGCERRLYAETANDSIIADLPDTSSVRHLVKRSSLKRKAFQDSVGDIVVTEEKGSLLLSLHRTC